MNTMIVYLYRDAANYKHHGQFTFSGTVPAQRLKEFCSAMPSLVHGGTLFVPDQVDIPNLRDEMPGSYEDDTRWNEILSICETDAPADTDQRFHEFITRCLDITTTEAWDDQPRIDHDAIILSASPHENPLPADRWVYQPGDQWIASTPDETHLNGLDPQDLPARPVRPLRPVPATGLLRWRTFQGHGDSRRVVDMRTETPGQVTITAGDVRRWSGRALTQSQLKILAERIPHSTITEAIAAIVDGIN